MYARRYSEADVIVAASFLASLAHQLASEVSSSNWSTPGLCSFTARFLRTASLCQAVAFDMLSHKDACMSCKKSYQKWECAVLVSPWLRSPRFVRKSKLPPGAIALCSAPPTKKRVTKSNLWVVWFSLNDIKVGIHQINLTRSHSRREKKLLKFLSAAMAGSPSANWDTKGIVYCCLLDFPTTEYFGETSAGGRHRISTHIRHTTKLKGNQWFHRDLATEGAHFGIWYVLHAGESGSTKIQRLRKEGALIWHRDSYWNKLGSRTATGATPYGGETWLGKVRRFKLLKRIKDIAHGAKSALCYHPQLVTSSTLPFVSVVAPGRTPLARKRKSHAKSKR